MEPTGVRGVNPEAQLVGCVLHCARGGDVLGIARVVPAEVIEDRLHHAIFTAAVDLARLGRWDPASVARQVHLNGWPRDVHGQVTGRIVDLVADCAWPSAWQEAAAEVIELHARRRLAAVLQRTEDALGGQPLAALEQSLTDAADIVRSCGALLAALTGEPVL